jgi:hypothetical protein
MQIPEVPGRRVLHSWKEIAAFLGTTIRSVQRWEKSTGLPVHRHGGGITNRIFAYADELERWRESGQVPAAEPETQATAVRRRPSAAWIVVGISIAGLAALILLKGGMLWKPKVPSVWRFENSALTVTDAGGRICWVRPFPPFDRSYETEVLEKVLIADIDADGRQEVLVNVLPANLGNAGGSLMCFEQAGRLRWTFRYGSAKTFGGRSFNASYRGSLVRPVQIAGRPHLLTVANHYLWYPSQTALIDPLTGRLEGEYWHPGAIQQCVLSDLDGDGQDELLLGGINNPGEGLGHAALAILKLPFSKAARPSVPGDLAITGGGELAYLLFPLPDVSQAAAKLPVVTRLSVDDRHHILVETPLPEDGGAVYSLSPTLAVEDVRMSDNFVPLHNRFYLSGMLGHRLGDQEMASLRNVVRFAAAPDGNSPEVKRFWQY